MICDDVIKEYKKGNLGIAKLAAKIYTRGDIYKAASRYGCNVNECHAAVRDLKINQKSS